jgi:hypothetical protein
MNTEQKPRIRPITRNLIEAAGLDQWPSAATCVDFGIETADHLGALQFAIVHEEVPPERLDAALGNGAEIQKLISEDNPYRFVSFETDWDHVMRTMNDGNARWVEFGERLAKALGYPSTDGKAPACPGDLSKVAAVLADMDMDVERSLGWFKSMGYRCDCEIMFEAE